MSIQRCRNTEVIAAFGSNLRKLRTQKNLTQEELAAMAEICTSQIARIESGKLNTTISTIHSISRALGILPSELFGWYSAHSSNNTSITAPL